MSNRRSYREQFLERIKEASPDGGGRGDNNETADSINLAAADSSSEKRDMQLRLDQSKIHVDIPIRFPNLPLEQTSAVSILQNEELIHFVILQNEEL